jgi:TetR/AcrR family transcriptional regulator, transcriptional repressor for nem operon
MGRISNAHERLLTVAGRLLQTKSYGAIGVDAICKMAGVNKGSFYHFYPAKSDLVLAVMERAWEEFQQQVLEPSFRASLSPGDRFREFFAAVYARRQQQQQDNGRVGGCLFGNLGCELSGQEEVIRQRTEQIMARIEIYFQQALSAAAEQGLVRAEDREVLVKAFMACWQGMERLAKLTNNAEVIREAAAGIVPFLARPVAEGKSRVATAASVGSASPGFSGALDFID